MGGSKIQSKDQKNKSLCGEKDGAGIGERMLEQTTAVEIFGRTVKNDSGDIRWKSFWHT
jgi:hypothetical protein